MAQLSLSLLGSFQSWVASGSPRPLRTLKERALISYLVVESNRSHRREKLAELLWPDRPESVARNNLRQALYGLRQAVGEPGFETIFTVTADDVQIATSDQLWLDLDAFKVHVKAAQIHEHDSNRPCPFCMQHLRDAVEMYRGPFLEDVILDKAPEFTNWALHHRENCDVLHSQALEFLIQEYERIEDYAQAAFYARRQVESDGRQEDHYQRLMVLLAKSGRQGEALEQFDMYRRHLTDLSGLEPQKETVAIAEKIRTGGFDLSSSPARAVPVSNIPEQLTPFIGREMELSQVIRQLENPSCRLITLLGLAGVGKTRLAVQAVQVNRRLFPDGVFFIPLEAVQSPSQLVDVIGKAFGLVPGGQNSMRALLFDYLQRKHVLIVLDNFEHLLEGKDLLVDILKELPFVKLLVTSRERLSLQSECLVEMHGMSFPSLEAVEDNVRQDWPVVRRSDALRLLLERASRLRSSAPWQNKVIPDPLETASNAPSAEEYKEIAAALRICQLVDGLPLAIELAASWSRDYSFAEIADEVQRSLEFLQTSFQDLPERHRSMRASFEHSWELLSESEREVFCKLAVFPGSFSATVAQDVASAALPWLIRLEDKSLVRRVAFGRFDLHPLIRQFASQKLRQYSRKVEDATHQQHAEYFCSFLGARERDLKGERQIEALIEMDAEIDNIYAAWDWAVENRAIALLEKAAFTLMLYLEMRGQWREGEERFQKALECLAENNPSPVLNRLRSSLLSSRAWFCCRLSSYQQVSDYLNESLRLLGDQDSSFSRLFAHFVYGFFSTWMNLFDEAQTHLLTSLSIAERNGDGWGIAWSRQMLTEIAFESGQAGNQEQTFLDNLSKFENIGEKRGSSRVLNYLGNIALSQDQYERAQAYFEKMLVNVERVGDVWGLAGGYSKLGQLAAKRGDYEQAWRFLQRSLSMLQKMGDKRRSGYTMREMGDLSAGLARMDEAESYFRQALETAVQIQATPLAQDILISIASLYRQDGQPEFSMELLKLVLQETIVDRMTAIRASDLRESLRETLPIREFAQLQKVVGHNRMWDAVDELLRKPKMF